MAHTEGKWEISQEGMNIEIYSDHVGKIANISADYINAHPNAHHICKCVNGWDELQAENKALRISESAAHQDAKQFLRDASLLRETLKSAREIVTPLQKQRDALLEACKDIHAYEEARRKMASDAPLPDSVVCKLAREAISLCEK